MMKVSVIIPTWNRAKFLSSAINSVLNQNWPDLEIIICDDGSTDNTEKIIQSMSIKGLKYFKLPHTGIPAIVRNYGIMHSTGDYIAFLDSDDVWLKDKLNIQFDLVNQNHCKIVGTNAYKLNSKKNLLLASPPVIASFNNLLRTNWLITSSVVVERSLLVKAGSFPEESIYKGYEDWLTWMRLATYANAYIINQPLVNYRDEPIDSIRSKQADWKSIIKTLQLAIIPWGMNIIHKHPYKIKLLASMLSAYLYANKRS